MDWSGLQFSVKVGAFFFVTFALGACAQMGNRFDEAKVNDFRPGVTTISEAESGLGPPSAQSAAGDGGTLLQWQFAYGTALGVGGGAHVAILFGPDGKMVRVVHESAAGTEQGSFGQQPLPGNQLVLGIHGTTISLSEGAARGLVGRTGVIVVDVVPNSVAARSGIVGGDIVLAYDGKPTPTMFALKEVLAHHTGTKNIVLWRQGHEQKISVIF